tara:strand:+ start:4389 stop:5483 length:1095 start_codon:yes stop_codon:yes gene_type:complete
MNKKFLADESDVNLFELLKIIWDDKIKIIVITIISILIGVGYNYILPKEVNTYKYSLKIKSSDSSEFIKFVPMYNFLKIHETNLSGISLSGLKLQNETSSPDVKEPKTIGDEILQKFIQELTDYEELIFTLQNNEKFNKKISGLSKKDQEKILFNYAKSFSINSELGNEASAKFLNFFWKGDQDIVPEILEETFNLTLDNLKQTFYNQLDDLFKIKIDAVINEDKRKVAYLLEQSEIAKKLNIPDNQIAINNFSSSNVLFNFNTDDAYYLRGYKAIDTEIKLIEDRKYEFFQYLKNELENAKQKKTKWVHYNIYLLEKELIKNLTENSPVSLKIIGILGLILGMLYVLISRAFIAQINDRKKAN